MDKNMISIDDLIRQRLEGGEEKERPGAWLQMRDVLDKNMPQKSPGGFINWYKTLSYAGVLLLAAAVSAGGYKAANYLIITTFLLTRQLLELKLSR